MVAEHSDALADVMVSFVDVTIVRAAAPALLCRIGQRKVWLSRRNVAGKLWCAGDRGTLFVRYGVARELNLLGALKASALYALEVSCSQSERREPPHLVCIDASPETRQRRPRVVRVEPREVGDPSAPGPVDARAASVPTR